MKSASIAAVVFQVNAAMLTAFGKAPLGGKLEDAPEEYRIGLLAKVEEFKVDPDAALPPPPGTDKQPVPDADMLVHRVQAATFRALVDALKGLADEAMPAALVQPMTVSPTGQKFLPVKYIGKREVYRDGTYGSGVEFVRGTTRMIAADIAALMLRHPDVYEPGEAGDTVPQAAAASKPPVDDEESVQQQHDAIAHMTKDALATYAKTHFRVDLDQKKRVGDLREEVARMIDQFGVT